MKKTKWILGAVVAALIIGMTGCGAIAAALAAPQGYVYDGRTGDPLSGVTVQLKDLSGNILKTATTSSTGYYSFSSVDYGEFELTATGNDHVFIQQLVEVSGIAQTLPNIAGITKDFDNDGTDDLVSGVLTIVTFWNRDFADVDAHLSFPVADNGVSTFNSIDFYNPASEATNAGFYPDTDTDRFIVSKNQEISPATKTKTSDPGTTGGDIWLDTDSSTSGGPETITVFWPPRETTTTYAGGTSYSSSGTSDPSKLPTGNYSCMGIMQFYLDAPAAESMLSDLNNDNAADPVVYVFDGESQIALYRLPLYTDIERATVFRINMFVQETTNNVYYQILPDLRILDDTNTTNIRSATLEIEPVVVKARSRN